MGIGAITPDAAGAVTAPSPPLLLSAPSATSITNWSLRRTGLRSHTSYPGRAGFMFTSGLDPMFHVLADTVLRTGLLAPYTAPSLALASSGQRAAVVGTYTNQPSNDETITLGVAGAQVVITWKTTLVVDGTVGMQVFIGADADTSYANLAKLVNGNGTQGIDFFNIHTFNQVGDGFDDNYNIEVVHAPAGNTVTFTYLKWGSLGNAAVSTDTTSNFSFATTTFTGGHDGGGFAPPAGRLGYTYGFRRRADDASSGISNVATIDKTSNGNVALTSLANAEQDEGIDVKVWLRTQTGGATDEMFEGYRIDEVDTSDTDDISDETIATHVKHDASIHRNYAMGQIPRLKYMVTYKGMWFAGGINRAANYSAGAADVTLGSRVVSFDDPAQPTKAWEGRTFSLVLMPDGGVRYTIVWVDETNKDVYLDRPYEGTSATDTAYTVADERDAFALYRCEPLKPNQTNATMLFTGVTSPDPDGMTGLAFAFESILIFTKTGLWRLTGTGTSPLTSRLTNEFEGVGCISHHSIIYTGSVVMWLGNDGFYSWAPGQAKPTRISDPDGLKMPAGIARDVARINLLYAHNVFGHYDQERGLIRWLVPLDGSSTNRHALVYEPMSGRWAGPWQYPDLTWITTVSGMDGALHNLAGDVYGDVLEIDVGNADGYFGAEPKQAITASTTRTITCGAASFSTTGDGLKGLPVVIVDTATGDFQTEVIASNTGTVLTLTRVLSAAPTGVVMVGGIHWRPVSGRTHFGRPQVVKQVGKVVTVFSPQSDGQVWVSTTADQGDTAVKASMDFTLTDGEELAWANDNGRFFRIQYDCIEPGMDPILIGTAITTHVPDRVAV